MAPIGARRARDVRGFNYSGSWGTSGLDLWLHHDRDLMRTEVARGVAYFPGWNVARWWLSHEAYTRNPARFLADFEDGLAIFAGHGIDVMPVLFNRWRDPLCDFGGVSFDHIVPGSNHFLGTDDYSTDASAALTGWGAVPVFRRYLDAVVGSHRDDPRIYAWDLCNEPLGGEYARDPGNALLQAELRWLQWCADTCRAIGAEHPITIGGGAEPATNGMVDLISFHPYYFADFYASPADYEGYLDRTVALARAAGKELLASETVWGAEDDAVRVDIMRYTLGALRERDIGFIVHALHHSLVADLHSAEHGPVGLPRRLEFILADGSLRPGHDAFNDYAGT